MRDYYLKFADEAEADKILPSYDGAIDVIGKIYKYTGKVLRNEEGEYQETAAVPGWHVNVRGEPFENIEEFMIEVNSPVRVWA